MGIDFYLGSINDPITSYGVNIQACKAPIAAGQVINIACCERYTLIDLVNMINEILGNKHEPKFSLYSAGDMKHSLAGIYKAKELLDY